MLCKPKSVEVRRERETREPNNTDAAKQPVHSFLGDKGLGVQQETSVWVGLPKSK